ncbi:MAG: hypothetical protein C0425_06355 [Chlorobiaceae bacterium]|nr:hypothetical protein [Chlorobiaceae bacterium]MBA4309942.1 hypothetical protein [Chlorobiaceae bacterium]
MIMKKIFTIAIFFSLFSQLTFSQRATLSGKVETANNIPIVGANVVIRGIQLGDETDLEGNYEISNLPFGNYTIEVSSLGYRRNITRNFAVNKETINLNFVLVEELIRTEEVIVTAGKFEQNLSELPVSAELVKSEIISARNYQSLDFVLRDVPGVNVTLDQVSIRGSSGYSRGAGTRVLVALDGIPLYTGDTGEIIWEIFPLHQIDRVEVVKGAASSLYGSTAIGGVINVITKEPTEKSSYYFKASMGFYDRPIYEQWDWAQESRPFNSFTFGHSNKINNFSYTISLSRLQDLSYRKDGFANRLLGYTKLNYQINPKNSVSLFVNHLNMNRGNFIYWKDINNVLIQEEAVQNLRVKSNRTIVGLQYKNLISSEQLLNFNSSFYSTDWRDETTAGNNSKTNLFRNELSLTSYISNAATVVTGIEIQNAKVNSNIFQEPVSFSSGVFAQLQYKTNFNLITTLGIRYDYTKLDTLDSFNAFSPKLGLNYRLSDRTVLRGSVGFGFRAPSLAEVFTTTNVNGIRVKPNPKLKSESNWSSEIGFSHRPNNFFEFDLALFHNEFYDMIEPGFDSRDGQIFFSNLVRARIQGLEMNNEVNLIQDIVTLKFNYTYLWGRNLETNKALKYRPRHMTNSSINFSYADFSTNLIFRYWSRIEEIDDELISFGLVKDGDERVDVYLVDLNINYSLLQFGLPVRASFNINNLFNYYYVEMIGNLAPIRNYSLSLEALIN